MAKEYQLMDVPKAVCRCCFLFTFLNESISFEFCMTAFLSIHFGFVELYWGLFAPKPSTRGVTPLDPSPGEIMRKL